MDRDAKIKQFNYSKLISGRQFIWRNRKKINYLKTLNQIHVNHSFSDLDSSSFQHNDQEDEHVRSVQTIEVNNEFEQKGEGIINSSSKKEIPSNIH